MDNDKFDSEKVKAQGILNKEGIKPVVKFFIQRFGIEAGLNSIKNLVAMLLYCSLNEKDDAFKQFIILFTQKINDDYKNNDLVAFDIKGVGLNTFYESIDNNVGEYSIRYTNKLPTFEKGHSSGFISLHDSRFWAQRNRQIFRRKNVAIK